MGLTHRASGDKDNSKPATTIAESPQLNISPISSKSMTSLARTGLAESILRLACEGHHQRAHLEQCAKLDAAYAAVLLLEQVS